METDRATKICKQVEYYFSDKNLASDLFFRKAISASSEGFIGIDILLKCNKIKLLGVTEAEEILKACAASTEVEIKGDQIRRAGNKALPEQKLLEKKRTKPEPKEKKDPVILTIKSKPTETRWSVIKEKFNEANPSAQIIYIRFDKEAGHLAIEVSGDKLEFTETLTIDGVEFTFAKCEGQELIDFWTRHGSHLEMCLGGRDSRDRKAKRNSTRLRDSVELGGEVFVDASNIKHKTRKILSLAKNNEKLSEDSEKFLKDLLKYHKSSAEKLKDFDHFVVDNHPVHDFSRCFFAVDKKGNKTDFSGYKCIDNLVIEANKK